MALRPDRLVRRIQRRQQSAGSIGAVRNPEPREIAELEARLRTLHALGERFSHARLSSDVTSGDVTEARIHVRGEFVATDV